MNNNNNDPYIYPGTDTLRNKFGIQDGEHLKRVERLFTADRLSTLTPALMSPEGFQQIHRHLFQDIYEWAGELRTIELSKGDSVFMPTNRLSGGLTHVFDSLKNANYLKAMDIDAFAKGAAAAIGEINYAHPFREGNGRTMRAFLDQLARQAGHRIDLRKIDRIEWLDASIQCFRGDNRLMTRTIRSAAGEPARD